MEWNKLLLCLVSIWRAQMETCPDWENHSIIYKKLKNEHVSHFPTYSLNFDNKKTATGGRNVICQVQISDKICVFILLSQSSSWVSYRHEIVHMGYADYISPIRILRTKSA